MGEGWIFSIIHGVGLISRSAEQGKFLDPNREANRELTGAGTGN
jgi:hypothetical protein